MAEHNAKANKKNNTKNKMSAAQREAKMKAAEERQKRVDEKKAAKERTKKIFTWIIVIILVIGLTLPVAGLSAARDDDEDVRLLGQLQSRQQLRHRPRRVEPVAGIDQPDAPLPRQVLMHRLTERHHRFVESLRDVAADCQAVARA